MSYSSVIAFIVIFCTYLVNSANILGYFMVPSISHQVVYQPIWRELSLRGHQVTVVTPDPLNDPRLVNLTEISVRHAYEVLETNRLDEIASKDANPFVVFSSFFALSEKFLDNEFNNPKLQELLQDKNKSFDLILMENFHPVLLGLGARFNAPVISVFSLGALLHLHEPMGNPNHPVLHPDLLLNYHSEKLSLYQRIESTLYGLWTRFYYKCFVLPHAQELAKKYFGDSIPDIGALEKNTSMMFLNVNPILYPARPTVPAIVHLGHMHIKPVKPLPKDLKQLLDEAKEGVVYFSLGSNVKSVNMPEELRTNIIKALAELPYKVLWKWESDHLPGKPDNVVIRKWLPQQDVLAHPNVKVFVTQGGLQSIEEAISRGVPLVGLPFMGDQPMNVQKIQIAGMAIGLDPVSLTKDELKNTIIEVAENAKFRNKALELRELLNDEPMTGLERAVWWSEYVIRHKGARQLRSSTVDISWFEYLLLDVISVLVLMPVIIIYLLYKLVIVVSIYNRHKLKKA